MSWRNKWLERNGITLAVIVSITIALVLIITVFWYSNDWTATGAVALACFGAIGIVFNYVSTTELKRYRVPYVHVNFTSYEEKRHSIYVVVQNSGNAPAHDVKINASSLEIEDKLLESGAIFSSLQKLSFIKHPIQLLPPNDSRRTLFGNITAMEGYGSEAEYEVNVSYKDYSRMCSKQFHGIGRNASYGNQVH